MKRFMLKPEQIKPLCPGRGACFASDMITVQGKRVGYMYRESPDNNQDSGWRFFSGLETDEYANTPENIAIYDVNTICNYDPDVIPFVDEPLGSAFERDASSGKFKKIIDGV